MKKYLLLSVFAILMMTSFAQTTKKIAPDFTAITMDSDTIVLSDLLSQPDQYVLLEFFFNESQICQETSPAVNDAYHRMGCNQENVFFLSVNVGNDSSQCRKYMDSLSLQNVIASGIEGNGNAIADSFNIQAYPSIILISSQILQDSVIVDSIFTQTDTTFVWDVFDYNIVENDIWPVYVADDLIDTLKNYGLSEHPCSTGIQDPETGEVAEYFRLYPNPNHGEMKLVSSELNGAYIYQIMDLSGKVLAEKQISLMKSQEKTLDFSWLQKGIYFLRLSNNNQQYTQKLIVQ